MLTQLNPPLPLETPKGEGMAYAVIDYGPDFDLLWVVFDDATGECWTWPNPKIRAVKNVTMGHRLSDVGRPRNGITTPMNGSTNGSTLPGYNGHSNGHVKGNGASNGHASRLAEPAAP